MRQKKLAELKSRGTCMQSRDRWTVYMQRFDVQWLDGHFDSSVLKGARWTRGGNEWKEIILFCGPRHHTFMEHLGYARSHQLLGVQR